MFKKALGQCSKFGVTVSTEAVYMGLEKMVKELVCRPNMTIHLAGVRRVIADSRGDGSAMIRCIVAVAGDCNELSAAEALPTREQHNGLDYNQRDDSMRCGNGSYGVEHREKTCLSFREYGGCRDGDQCEMKHITPDKECENDEYKKHGFCDNYWNCECSHPWDASRGDKHVKYREWMRERSNHK